MTSASDTTERVAQVLARLGDTMEPDEARVRRFLRARKGDVDATCAMLQADEQWRRSYISSLQPSMYSARIAQRKAYFHGITKEGLPLAVVLAGRHRNTESVKENIAFAIYMLELAIDAMGPGVERIMVIVDCEGVSMQCIDLALVREAIALLDRHYPERLGLVCVLDAPLICTALWSAVKLWLDQATRDRICFLRRKEAHSTLLRLVEPQWLPEKYGGTSQFDFDGPDGVEHPIGLLQHTKIAMSPAHAM